jgi:hypothetical protein
MGLRHGVGEGGASSPAALCSACKRINVPNLVSELDALPDWLERSFSQSKPRGMQHVTDARRLPTSAAGGCSMCRLILDAVIKWDQSESAVCQETHANHLSNRLSQRYESTWTQACDQDIAQIQQDLIDRPIYLRPSIPSDGIPIFPGDDVTNSCHLYGFKAMVPVNYGVLECQILLYALPESQAGVSCDVITRPALPSSDSPNTFDLVNCWLNACLSKHDACKKALCGTEIDESTPPVLPTRIIHVGAPDAALRPRLIETNGKLGHYVTLSHCLRNVVDGHSLETNEANLKNHLAGIPWDDIPIIFQDAMTITHRLGLEFIWIDSLCVLQDSPQDQLRESARKGTIFENALLTIAASHATDLSQSLFSKRHEGPPPIELQHISQNMRDSGSVFAIPKRQDNKTTLPEFSPLASHAWATEELMLSRRTILYTPNAITWSCKRLSQRETGVHFHTTVRNPQWRVVVEKHSARSVEKPSDRLEALVRTPKAHCDFTRQRCFSSLYEFH